MKEDLYLGKKLVIDDVNDCLEEFFCLYNKRPIIINRGGMNSSHMFWVWYLLKKENPQYVIESGVFKGQSTWLIKETCPEAKVFSIDPFLDKREYINDSVTYFDDDFSLINWKDYLDEKECICFFDDHQSAYDRLQQMKFMGFKKAIFEDNYPVGQGDCYSIKKALEGKGFSINGREIVKPNKAHEEYIKKNVATYFTCPPLYKPEVTRWGDKWEMDNYFTDASVASSNNLKRFPTIIDDSKSYTWICYVELN